MLPATGSTAHDIWQLGQPIADTLFFAGTHFLFASVAFDTLIV